MALRTNAKQTHRAQKVVETIEFIENGRLLACCESASLKVPVRSKQAPQPQVNRLGWCGCCPNRPCCQNPITACGAEDLFHLKTDDLQVR